MITNVLTFGFLAILYSQNTGIPEWYYQNNASQAAVCVKVNSGDTQLRTIAIAKAQAELLRQEKVSVHSELIITHEENTKTGASSSTMDERITQKSDGVVEENRILKSGMFIFDDAKHYCILYGKEKHVAGMGCVDDCAALYAASSIMPVQDRKSVV